MRGTRFLFVATLFALTACRGISVARQAGGEAGTPALGATGPQQSIPWGPAPAVFPPGAQFAVLAGDPTKAEPFTVRLRFPDGYKIPPHTHPKVERLTVISGTIHVGMGEKFEVDGKAHALPAGSLATMPAGMKHFAWAKGETILQLHGTGPWSIQYLNPDDDPRNKK